MYETAAPFFELAAQVQPQEVKWHLMVASCFRRTGNQQQVSTKAFPCDCYKQTTDTTANESSTHTSQHSQLCAVAYGCPVQGGSLLSNDEQSTAACGIR